MPNEARTPLKVFLCHASGDKPAVRALYRRLIGEGIDAWLDQEKLLPGQDWRDEIPQAVRESDVVVICLSNKSITKEGYVQKEIEFALDIAGEKPPGTIFLIPARLEDCEVPTRLNRWQWVDLFSPNGYENLMRSLRVRANKLGVPLENPIYVDKELEQRIDQLYTEGSAALWVEDWEKAYQRFQTILREMPDHLQAAAKLEEAKRQIHLNALYTQAIDAQKNEHWPAVIQALEQLTNEDPEYKDASFLLKDAQKKNRLARLYEEARKLYHAQQWQAVVSIFAHIASIDPDYQDPEGLLQLAENKVGEQKQLDKLNNLYSSGIRAMDSGDWREAHQLLKQIQEAEPAFRETERLLAKVEAEVKKVEEKQWREDQISTLYEQAHGLLRSRMWRAALDKVDDIRKLDEQFTDSSQIAHQAQQALEREAKEVELHNTLSTVYAEAVRLLRERKYQHALEKWQEIVRIDPNYSDPQKVEALSKKKLGELTKSSQKRSRILNLRLVGLISSMLILVAIIVWGFTQFLSFPSGTINAPESSTPPASPTPFTHRIWNFDSSESSTDWRGHPSDLIFSNFFMEDFLTFTTTGPDPFIHSPGALAISAAQTPIITIRMKIDGTGSRGAIYFITSEDYEWNEEKRVTFPLRTGVNLETYDIDMTEVSTWQGTIIRLRLDPVDQPDPLLSSVRISIDYIWVHAR